MDEKRKTRTPITDELRDKALFLTQKGLSPTEAANMLAIGTSTVHHIRLAYDLVATGNLDGIRGNSHLTQNASLLKWACDRNMADYRTLMAEVLGQELPEPEPAPPATDLTPMLKSVGNLKHALLEESSQTTAITWAKLEAIADKLDTLIATIQDGVEKLQFAAAYAHPRPTVTGIAAPTGSDDIH